MRPPAAILDHLVGGRAVVLTYQAMRERKVAGKMPVDSLAFLRYTLIVIVGQAALFERHHGPMVLRRCAP